jgi:hypothetical protein
VIAVRADWQFGLPHATNFYTHCEPRLRDNEQRTPTGRPLRDGPLERRGNP